MDRKIAAQRWVLGGGIFNCIVAFPFSMPFLHESYINLFNWLNTFLRLGGNDWIPPSSGENMLFLNTAGLALFLVGRILIYASKNISSCIEIALFNGIIRFVWAMITIYYLVSYDIINLLYLIVVIDLILASSYVYFYFTIKSIRSNEAIA